MYYVLKSRRALYMATILLLSSAAQPAFASICLARPGSTSKECAKTCAWAAVSGPLGFALCL